MKAALVLLLLLVPGVALATTRCVETSRSRAVGLARCRRFGSWDTRRSVVVPALEAGTSLHMLNLPQELKLCEQAGKTCRRTGSMRSGRWASSPLVIASVDLGVTLLALGPLRLGFGMSFGVGEGANRSTPATFAGAEGTSVRPGPWLRVSGDFMLSLRGGSGPWALSMDMRPGFSGLSATARGLHIDGKTPVASFGGAVMGARIGAGYFLTPWILLGPHLGASVGSVREVNTGLSLRFSFAAYDRTHG